MLPIVKMDDKFSTLPVPEFTKKLLLLSGILLASTQYLLNRSLFTDEAILALNIIHRSFYELLQPLDSIQVAPILFLLIEKFFSFLIPNSEYGLRLFPLICYFTALLFLFKLLKASFDDSPAFIFGLSLFVFNALILRYATEIKQYMGDVMLAAAIGYFTLQKFESEKKRHIALMTVGTVGVFLSNVAPVILLASGGTLFYRKLFKESKNFKPLFLTFAVWLSVFLVYYLFFIHDHANRHIQISAFEKRNGFFEVNPFHTGTGSSFFEVFKNLFHIIFPFGVAGTIALSILFTIGIVAMVNKKNYDILIFAITPIIAHLTLSALKMYPIMPRLMLYLSVSIIIVATTGFALMINYLKSISKPGLIRLFIMLIPLLMLIQIFASGGFPHKTKDIKETLKYVEHKIKPDESLFVDNKAFKVFSFYRDINFFDSKSPVIFEKPQGFGKKSTIESYDMLTGKNWLLFAGGNPRENLKLIKQLRKNGFQVLDEFIAKGSSVHLVDFDTNNKQKHNGFE